MVSHTMVDVRVRDEDYPGVSDTPNHQEGPGGHTCHDLTHLLPPSDRHRSQRDYNLVAHALNYLVVDWDIAVQDKSHVVVLNIHLFHRHDLYRTPYPRDFLGLVGDPCPSHRHLHRQYKDE